MSARIIETGTASYTHVYRGAELVDCSEAKVLVPGEWAECPHLNGPMYRDLIWIGPR